MKYNKFQFHKTNDKKILHKVRKQWVIFSVATLAMLGVGAFKTQQATHADADANHQSTQKMNVSDQQNHSMLITPHHDEVAATDQSDQTASYQHQNSNSATNSQTSSVSPVAKNRLARRMNQAMPTTRQASSKTTAASQTPKDPRYNKILNLAKQGHQKFLDEASNISKTLSGDNVSGPKASVANTASASSALSAIESEARGYNKHWEAASQDASNIANSLKASNYGSTTFSYVNDLNQEADSAAPFQNQILSAATTFSSAVSADSKSTSMNFGNQRQQILSTMSNNAIAMSNAFSDARNHRLSNAGQAYTELAQLDSNFQAVSNSINQELNSAQTALKTTSGVDSAESAIQAANQNDSQGYSDAMNASNVANGRPMSKASSSASGSKVSNAFSLNQSSLASDEASLSRFSNQVNQTLQPESGSIGKAYQMYQSYAKAHPNSKATSTVSALSNIASNFNKYSSAAHQEISNASTDFKIAGSYSNNSSVVSKATDAAVKCISAAKQYFGAANYLYTGKSSTSSSSSSKSSSNQANEPISNGSTADSEDNESEPTSNSDEEPESEGNSSEATPQSEGTTETATDPSTGSQNTGNANVSGASTGTTTNNDSQSGQQLPQTGEGHQVMGKAGIMLMLMSLALSSLKMADDSRRRDQ